MVVMSVGAGAIPIHALIRTTYMRSSAPFTSAIGDGLSAELSG
jgi:hypothetical protein